MHYPLKSMTLGEILDTAFKVFRNNFAGLFAVNIVIQALSFGVLFLAAIVAGQADSAGGVLLGMLPLLIPILFLGPLGTAISTRLIADSYLGNPTSVGGAFSAGIKVLLPLMGAIFLSGLLIMFGLVLLVIPGLLLALRFALVAPATIVEQRGGMTALRRSGELAKGEYGKFFCILLYGVALSFVFSLLITVALGSESMGSVIAQYVLNAALGAYVATIWTITYFERRCAQEGFDIQRLAESLGVDASDEALAEEEPQGDEWE